MATVNKDFKIKSGLIIEGTTATLNGVDILAKNAGSDTYILNLTGGATLVKSVSDEFVVSGAGALSIDRSVVDTYYDANGAAAQALSDAQDYADTAEADAITSANGYTDTRETAITTAYQSYADTAEVDAKAYTDTRETAITTAYQTYADTAETDAIASAATYTDGEITTALSTAGAAAQTAEDNAKEYTDTLLGDASLDGTAGNTVTDRIASAVSDLVDGAPALLDTLNELAAALGDDENFASSIGTSIGEKVSKSGDTMSGALAMGTNKITGLGTPTASTDASTKGYVDGEISTLDTAAQGYASDAQAAAEATASADATSKANAAQAAAEATASADATAKADAAETAAIAYADALDTDDIAEAGSLYFTDARAKSSAADLLTGATLSNITITGTGTGLVITAENGVADSDTDDLAEGTSNLYFTDVRAVDALEAVVPNFTAVELNSVAKQVAATTDAPTAGVQVGHGFDKSVYRSAEYLVKVAYGTHTEISKVLLTLDTSDNIAITEYGIVGTNGSASSVSAGISGTDVQLLVTTANNNSTVTVMGTLLV